MIISKLLEALAQIIIFLVDLLPTIELPVTRSFFDFSVLADFLGYLETLVSFSVILSCIAIVVIFDNFSFIMKVLKWILAKFGLG